MTMRSKQWYTKASRPPNSRTKSSIGPLPPLRLRRQQEHWTEDRWKSKEKFQIFLLRFSGRSDRSARDAKTARSGLRRATAVSLSSGQRRSLGFAIRQRPQWEQPTHGPARLPSRRPQKAGPTTASRGSDRPFRWIPQTMILKSSLQLWLRIARPTPVDKDPLPPREILP